MQCFVFDHLNGITAVLDEELPYKRVVPLLLLDASSDLAKLATVYKYARETRFASIVFDRAIAVLD